MSEAPIKSIPARFGAFNDRRVSEELEGFVPGSMNLCKAAIAGAELPELWPRAWDRAGDIVPAAYGLRIAWRLLKKAYARKNPELTERYMAEFVQMLSAYLES